MSRLRRKAYRKENKTCEWDDGEKYVLKINTVILTEIFSPEHETWYLKVLMTLERYIMHDSLQDSYVFPIGDNAYAIKQSQPLQWKPELHSLDP